MSICQTTAKDRLLTFEPLQLSTSTRHSQRLESVASAKAHSVVDLRTPRIGDAFGPYCL